MKCNDLKNKLTDVVGILQKIMQDDLSTIRVTEEWSDIDDAYEHVQFLRQQTEGVLQHIKDKNDDLISSQSDVPEKNVEDQ